MLRFFSAWNKATIWKTVKHCMGATVPRRDIYVTPTITVACIWMNEWIFICHGQQHKKKPMSTYNSPDSSVRLNTALNTALIKNEWNQNISLIYLLIIITDYFWAAQKRYSTYSTQEQNTIKSWLTVPTFTLNWYVSVFTKQIRKQHRCNKPIKSCHCRLTAVPIDSVVHFSYDLRLVVNSYRMDGWMDG